MKDDVRRFRAELEFIELKTSWDGEAAFRLVLHRKKAGKGKGGSERFEIDLAVKRNEVANVVHELRKFLRRERDAINGIIEQVRLEP